MFLHDLLRRRLVALLRPWLPADHELDLDLQLGFITSRITARNLRLDASALNRLLHDDEESSSSPYSFEEVTVEHLSIRFSNWSVTAIKGEVSGLRVTLSVREVKNGARKSAEAVSDEKKKAVARIDPQGSELHAVLERILARAPSRNRFKTSFWNLVLKHGYLQILNSSLQVEVLPFSDSLVCLMELKEFKAESEFVERGSLLRGFLGTAFKPLKAASVVMEFKGFGIKYEMEGQANSGAVFADVLAGIKLNDLQVVELSIRVPELSLSFSPVDLAVLTIFGKVSSRESTRVRSGRQLWRLVANRLGYVISSPRLSLHNLVGFVFLWLRYLNAYESLLVLHGYSSANLLKRSAIRISQDEKFLNCVKQNWKVISVMEKELPAEAITQARRIARYRVAMNVEHGQDSYEASSINARFKVLPKILLALVIIWRVVCTIFLRIVNFTSLITSFFQEQQVDGSLGIDSENFCSQYCFLLNFGKVSIIISQDIDKHIRILRSDVRSFRLSVNAMLFVYTDEIIKQSFSISCGKLKVKSSSIMGATSIGSSSQTSSLKGAKKERVDDLITLWVKPAQIVLPSEGKETSTSDQAEGIFSPLLKDFIREMWLSWKSCSTKYEDQDIKYSEIPWLLCEIKNHLTYPGLHHTDCGFWKCSLVVGKVNINLDYSSVLSISMLLGQIFNVLNWNKEIERASSRSYLPATNEDQQEISWKGKLELYANRIKKAMHSMLPEKHIQLGAFVTGPHIHMSMRKVGLDAAAKVMDSAVSQVDFQLGFDIHDFEIVAWPFSGSDLAFTHWRGPDDPELECHKLPEPWIIDLPKLENEKFSSQGSISGSSYLRIGGMDVYMGDSVQSQIFLLKPISIRFSFFREFIHSLSTSVLASSAAFHALFAGATFVSIMDELYVSLQVVAGLCSAVSHAFCSIDINGYTPFHNFARRNMVSAEPLHDETNTEGEPLIYNRIQSSINGVFKLNSVDMVLQNSRMIDKMKHAIKTADALIAQKLAAHSFLDDGLWISVQQTCVEIACREQKLKALCHLLGIKFVIFRYQDHLLKSFDHSVVRNLQQHSHHWLYEISLSNCIFTLWLGHDPNTLNQPSRVEESHLIPASETSSAQPSGFASMEFASNFQVPPSSHWIHIDVKLGGIFVASCSANNVMVAHNFNKLASLLSVGEDLHTISWKIQGGILFLEAAVLITFVRCFASYLHLIQDLLAVFKSSVNSQNAERESQEILPTIQQANTLEPPKAYTVDVSQFSLVFAVQDGSGGFQELVVEVDAHVKLESAYDLRKFIFKLSRLSMFSQVFEGRVGNENRIPHFSSVTSNESSSDFLPGNHAEVLQHVNGSFTSHRNHILDHLLASVSAEMHANDALHVNQVWVGSGSVSGLEITVSISEIQMISSMVSSFSSFNLETTPDSRQRHWLGNQETDGNLGLEDLVKHHRQRIWKSSVLWFSFMSLYAKNNSGEPLRLNYHPGSGFVDISSSSDGGHSLWRAVSCEPESYSSDIELEPNNILVKNTFYLVNKKSDSSVALVNGIPEFVRKPGHPFKFKVFQDLTLVSDAGRPNGYVLEASRANMLLSAIEDDQRSSKQMEGPPSIQITVQSVVLNIVHELLDTKDRFYLLRGCINDTELNVQFLPFKRRIMITSNALFYYFDAQRDSWRAFGRPVELCLFYRSSFQVQGSGTTRRGVPVHFYCRAKELEVSITEHSLDILLFVIGKLNLAGPFSVRSSTIFANCCKVENQSGLNLICHFYNQKSVTVARKQSASIFLRHPVSGKSEDREKVSLVTIQLSNFGTFATSSLHVSLLKSRTLAWRTRITSAQDSKTYPGPFIVVDISRESEDGLSIVVSPLVRIYNETEFSMDLRFRRPQQDGDVSASVMLKKGDSIDDSTAPFDAIDMSGELKKTLMSLSVGNFLFSFRPKITDGNINAECSLSVEWSDELKGGKAVRLSGIFDKLGYRVRRALSGDSVKYSFSTACCTLNSGADVSNLHFLIQSIGRDVPVIHPDSASDSSGNKNSTVALQEQKEIFLLPTVQVSNLLHTEIHVLLSEDGLPTTVVHNNIGKQATIPCGSTVDFYANPSIMYLTVTLTAFRSSSKPVNSSDWIKKLLKKKADVNYLDIDLDFGGGKYFAILRLSRGLRGILEGTIFTPYSLKNVTDFSLFFFTPNQKLLSREEVMKLGPRISPEFGLLLPPNSTLSWFLRSNKLRLKLLDFESEAVLDLDALSGTTEISFELRRSDVIYIAKFGIAMGPSLSKVVVPSQTVTLVSRHIVFNESDESIYVRQCFLEDENAGAIHINSKQKAALQLQTVHRKIREFSLFENVIQKHRNDSDASLVHIQFQLDESKTGWSGPVCITSLGCFFLKFRKQSIQLQGSENSETIFAAVNVVEEGSTLGVHFHKPPISNLPYRIENQLCDASLTFYQKDSSEREVLASNSSVYYVWDDLTRPHKLVVLINDMNLREINMDKIRSWKPFLISTQRLGLVSHSFMDKISRDQKTSSRQLNSLDISKVGYEVYAEGTTRVLRICESSNRHKEDRMLQSCAKIQLRVFHFAIQLLEQGKQGLDDDDELPYTPIVVMRLGSTSLDSLFTDQKKYNQISVQSINVDLKWKGSPFAAMLRRHQQGFSDSDAPILRIACVLLSTSSSVRQVEYASIILQPIDLNVDEETLLRIASFWRTSLSDSNTPRREYYFDHFEVHPIKVPPVKNRTVELNGVLVTHALITMRELCIRCAKHYSWYAMRAIYIAKGSPLLPPAFASIFDDLASSSLDIFFDPSRALVNLPGVTIGTFRFISKCINDKGFSGTKRYFGDLGKTLRTVGSNMLFAAVTEISDSVLKGAEASGFDGMVTGFHHGILKLAMEPSLLGTALMGGGPDRKVKLDRSPGTDELYIEGYLQAMLDTMYRQEYLRVRVIDDQVFLKNLPPNSTLIDEIMDRVKGFLMSKGLLKGDPSASSRPLRHLQGDSEWKIGPTVLTLCEHLFVSFVIRLMRKQTGKFMANIKSKRSSESDVSKALVPADSTEQEPKGIFVWKWGIGKFVLSGILAYVDGRLCRCIPNPIARRIVSGYLLSFLDKNDDR
ncbi:hypothetical protein Tsubulata_024557 [Turnera subulata]|uniref:Vacuolar protein sorting-associated protein 13 VPS13 adaptor binding domain-containing protein n=1 Tax=Turnera subulata TaxID=218843 RepID=A0A9Q0G8B6_9ROSI|nr:hypothetical protein Tsubulata_024557 [Turnera subulata]